MGYGGWGGVVAAVKAGAGAGGDGFSLPFFAPTPQACHELVAPETLHPLISTLVTHFVSDKSRAEVIAIGINTVSPFIHSLVH